MDEYVGMLSFDAAGEPAPPSPSPASSVEFGAWAAWLLVFLGGCASLLTYMATGSKEATLLAAGALIIPAILISPLVGLCLMVLAIPTESLVDVVGGWVSVTRVLAMVTAIAFLPRMLRGDFRRMLRSRTGWVYFASFLWLLMVFPFAVFPAVGGLIDMITAVSLFGMVFLVGAIPRNLKQLRMLCLTSVVSAALLAGYVAVFGTGLFIRGWSSSQRDAGDVEHTLGQSFAVALVLAAIVWRDAGKTLRVLLVLMGMLITFGIGMSNSRATWAAVLAAVILGPLIARRVPMKHRAVFLISAALIGVVGFLLVFGDVFGDTGRLVRERVRTMLDPDRGPGTSGRLESVWPAYWEFFKEHPFTGGGWGTAFYIGFASHNDLLTGLAYGGVLGGLLYLLFMATAFLEASRNVDPWFRLITIVLCVYLLVFGFFHHGYISKIFALGTGILVCMANLGLCEKRRARQSAGLDAYGGEGP